MSDRSDSLKHENLHNAIQIFLNKFRKYANNDIFSFQFKCNPNVYIVESQLPDVWLKMRKPFNKNMCFVYDSEISHFKYNQGKQMQGKIASKSNYYPKTPFVIPDESSLKNRHLHLDKIEVDDLFNDVKMKPVDVIADDFELTKQNQTRPGIPSKEKEFHNKFSEVVEKVPINMMKLVEENEQEKLKKKWFLVMSNNSTFGPYYPEEIYVFVKHYLDKAESEEDRSFMVCDKESDIHYEPRAALDYLEDEVRDKIHPIDPKQELEKIIINQNEGYSIKNTRLVNGHPAMQQRKLSDNPRLITKFDVCEMNSKVKNVQFLPLTQLKNQLRYIKNSNNGNTKNMNHKFIHYKKRSFAKFYKQKNFDNYPQENISIYDYQYENGKYEPTKEVFYTNNIKNPNVRLVSIKDELFA